MKPRDRRITRLAGFVRSAEGGENKTNSIFFQFRGVRVEILLEYRHPSKAWAFTTYFRAGEMKAILRKQFTTADFTADLMSSEVLDSIEEYIAEQVMDKVHDL